MSKAIDWDRVVATLDMEGFRVVLRFVVAAEKLLTTDPQDTFVVDPDPYPQYCKICSARSGQEVVYDEHTLESHAEDCRYLRARRAYDAMVEQLTKGGGDATQSGD